MSKQDVTNLIVQLLQERGVRGLTVQGCEIIIPGKHNGACWLAWGVGKVINTDCYIDCGYGQDDHCTHIYIC